MEKIKTTVRLEIDKEKLENFDAKTVMEKMFKALESLGYTITLEKNEEALSEVQENDEKQA